MVSKSKVRIAISLPTELDSSIGELADMMGMTKSSFIGMCVGEKVLMYKKSFDILKDATAKTLNEQIPGQMSLSDFLDK